jgi:Lon protease-like protein
VTAIVLPIFPLPKLTFFPNTLLPLHVFEARYRAMVTDVLSRDRRLAVVGLKPGYERGYAGKPAVYAVAGLGEIVTWERLASGRYNILLRGEARARLEHELPADTLYRLVAARRLEETPPPGDVGPLLERVRAQCRRLLRALGRPRELLDEALRPGQPAGAIADQIASAVLPDPLLRQELLETLAVEARLCRLVAALDDLARHVTGRTDPDDQP